MTADAARFAEARRAYLLAIADDELVTGHRNAHWTGFAPSIEEDLAFSTLAQDEINHADVWYSVLVGSDRAATDALALGREADEYRHAVLCERPPGGFAYTLARQLLYDAYDAVRLDALTGSSESDVAAVARRLRHEERYHLEHAHTWLVRLARAGDEPLARLRAGIAAAWPDALWLFEPTPLEDVLVDAGVVPAASRHLAERWLDDMSALLDEHGLADAVDAKLPDFAADGPGGRRGVHTSDWHEDAWPEMTALYRAHPQAVW